MGKIVSSFKKRYSAGIAIGIFLCVCVLIASLLPRSISPAHAASTLQNPLGNGQDPSIKYYQGYYYYADVNFSTEVYIYKSAQLGSILQQPRNTIFHDSNEILTEAPDLNLLVDPACSCQHWFVYVSVGHDQIKVLESASDDPLSTYTDRGLLNNVTGYDPNILQLPNGSLYLLFSDYVPLRIIALSDPATTTGDAVTISTPTYSWEMDTNNPYNGTWNEAPAAIVHNGVISVIYSANFYASPNYINGILTATVGSNLLDPTSWSKSPNPAFQRSDANSVYGPGSMCFFASPDGLQEWIAYGAYSTSAGGQNNTPRTVRVQPISWNSDNTPNLGTPVSTDTVLDEPSSIINTSAYYKIVNQNSNKAADVMNLSTSAGTQVIQYDYWGGANQQWQLHDAGNGFFKIVNRNSGLVLDVTNSSTTNSANGIQNADANTTSQLWQLLDAGNGNYKIMNRNSGLLLAVDGASQSDGAFVQQYSDNGTPDHLWQLTQI